MWLKGWCNKAGCGRRTKRSEGGKAISQEREKMTPKELDPACCPSYPVVLLSIFRMAVREGGRNGDRRLFCSFDLGAKEEKREGMH